MCQQSWLDRAEPLAQRVDDILSVRRMPTRSGCVPPSLREDRRWIAREGDDVVGISMLGYPPTRGAVQTDWTGTARKVRGRVIQLMKAAT